MTVVGKILAFFVLAFSVVAGFLIVMLYVNSTNWNAAYEKLDVQYKALKADRDQTFTEATKGDTEASKKVQDVQKQLLQLRRERDTALAAEKAIREGRVADLEAQLKEANSAKLASQESANARKTEVGNLENSLGEARKRSFELIKEKNDERRERIKAEITAAAFKSRNLELEDKLKETAKDLARARAGTTATAARGRNEKNPPAEDIEGQVKTADLRDNLLTLTVGSDSGLTKGHTLDLFRLSAIPEQSKYLGTVQVMSVTAKTAVARPLGKLNGTPQPGDRVASQISPSGR